MTTVLLVLTIETKTLKKILPELTKVLLEGAITDVPNREATHIDVIKKIKRVAHAIHLPKMVIDIYITLHEKMVVMEVEVPMTLPVIMGTTLISLVVNVMILRCIQWC